ncbi:hypothetical protein BO71DRAFT_97468 [Aspergillus ellipticus CBS 707.79]|uniref:Uncharacterized protein n=1 Tax=Aspergillus ellipticus CBS 707.79 TaxID=1448320 RepID=A0A319CXC7_9EURO|nr:hypothetical protein BO71DRAFT_97468 [Aspergillus ellipticus CBS 707.79]
MAKGRQRQRASLGGECGRNRGTTTKADQRSGTDEGAGVEHTRGSEAVQRSAGRRRWWSSEAAVKPGGGQSCFTGQERLERLERLESKRESPGRARRRAATSYPAAMTPQAPPALARPLPFPPTVARASPKPAVPFWMAGSRPGWLPSWPQRELSEITPHQPGSLHTAEIPTLPPSALPPQSGTLRAMPPTPAHRGNDSMRSAGLEGEFPGQHPPSGSRSQPLFPAATDAESPLGR